MLLQDQCRYPSVASIATDQTPTITYYLGQDAFGYVTEQWLKQQGFFTTSNPIYCPVSYSYEALRGDSTTATQFEELITLDPNRGVFQFYNADASSYADLYSITVYIHYSTAGFEATTNTKLLLDA